MKHALVALALGATATVASTQAAPAIDEAVLIQQLTTALDSLARTGQFSGVVALAKNGAPVFERAYGMANRATSKPNTVETVFNIGSINKIFTATAIRQLAAAGKVDLDGTVDLYLPGYPNRDVASHVTVRQLLAHRGGVAGDIFAAPPGDTRASLRHNRDFLPLFANEPLAFEPGSRQEYSNAGYVLLGLIVERVSGEDYYEYVRKHITEPAGMSRTMHMASDSLPSGVAIGYTTRTADGAPGAALRPNSDMLPGRGSSAGGGYSTTHDLLRFLSALRAGRIPGGPPAGIGAAGGAPGLNAVMEGGLPGGYDLVVLANLDPPAAMQVARSVRQLLGAQD
ncbi:MAG: serine hydrolase domain-containing protein [Gemmatimonadaceae bacterium]